MGAKEDWIETYDSYTTEELDTEISTLKSQISNPYVNQSEGQRSYTRSLNEIRVRLTAATQVKRDRSGSGTRRHGQADFSNFK